VSGLFRFSADPAACGLCPIFAADFTSASNFGHASGSRSSASGFVLALLCCVVRFEVATLLGFAMPRDSISLRPSAFDLSTTQLKLVGLIALNWNSAEAWLAVLIGVIAEWATDVGQLVTADVSRLQLFCNLGQRLIEDKQLVEELLLYAEFFDKLRVLRNDFIHALPTSEWHSGKRAFEYTYVKRTAKAGKGTISEKQIVPTKEAMTTLARDITLSRYCATAIAVKLVRYHELKTRHKVESSSERSKRIHSSTGVGRSAIDRTRKRLVELRSPPHAPDKTKLPPRR
jgi:hypothetical protein